MTCLTRTLTFTPIAVAMTLAGCDDTPQTSETEFAIQQIACPAGTETIGALGCKSVLPIDKVPGTPGLPPWVVDGVRTNSEYWGATVFPYANIARKKQGGEVHVNVTRARDRLHVFLDNIPGSLEGQVRLYLDYDRFVAFPDGDPTFSNMTAIDRAYSLDLVSGAVTRLSPQIVGGTLRWMPLAGPVDYAAVLGAVTGTGNETRFDAEFSIPIGALTQASPGRPGVGFAVGQVPPENGTSRGGFPEDLVISGYTTLPSGALDPNPAFAPIDLDRRKYQTLIFAPPVGKRLSLMTWNVKRFTSFMTFWEDVFNPDGFPDENVPAATIGRHLARHDVVALQEAWDPRELKELVDAANATRATAGLPPFNAYGPIDWRNKQGVTFDDTGGGIYILAPFPAAQITPMIYQNCMGEDCLKAKGALHVRLILNRTTISGTRQGPPLSGDEFVDVYSTHLNHDQIICNKLDDAKPYFEAILAGLDISIVGAVVANALFKLVNDYMLRCEDYPDNAAVRAAQLAELNEFIEATADSTRSSIVMGDFNFNGRNLNNSSSEYGNALDILELGPSGMDPTVPAPEDWLSPWGGASLVPNELHHADVGREQLPDATWLSTGRGTFIGTDGLDDPSGTPSRLDYIFVRPPARPGTPEFDSLSWLVMRDTGAVWASPFPSEAGIPTIGNRLSDHKPVISSVRLVQLKVPDRFHPTWPHTLEVKVKSVNAGGNLDCAYGICGALDLYTERKRYEFPFTGAHSELFDTTTHCNGGGTYLTHETSACVQDWMSTFDHVPADDLRQGAAHDLKESDTVTDDDDYETVWADRAAGFFIEWPTGRIQLRRWDDVLVNACAKGTRHPTETCTEVWTDYATADNAPQAFCTRDTSWEGVGYFCYELSWEETP